MADAPLDADALQALAALIEEYDGARSEIARLVHTDDRGSGERTARLSSIGGWEAAQTRIIERIADVIGIALVVEYRDARGALDLDRLRALVEAAP